MHALDEQAAQPSCTEVQLSSACELAMWESCSERVGMLLALCHQLFESCVML